MVLFVCVVGGQEGGEREREREREREGNHVEWQIQIKFDIR